MSGNKSKPSSKKTPRKKTDRLQAIKRHRHSVTPSDVVWMIVEIEHLREKLDG